MHLILLMASAGCDSTGVPGSPDASGGQPGDALADAGETGSPGCTGLAAQTGDTERAVESDGRTRRFLVHVPGSYDPTIPTPVVLSFHGFTMDADQQSDLGGMNDLADQAGFIAVHPQGVSNSWNGGGCCGAAASDDIDDVRFVADLLDSLSQDLCVDTEQVYATGMSNGADMSYRLACDLAHRIAGVAPVAGTNSTDTCSPGRSVPVIHFHGTADLIVPLGGGILDSQPPADEAVATWAARNGCSATTTEVFANGDSVCEQFDDCPAGAAVTLCLVDGGGHTWPGGEPLIGLGKTTTDLSATAAMWQFWVEQL